MRFYWNADRICKVFQKKKKKMYAFLSKRDCGYGKKTQVFLALDLDLSLSIYLFFKYNNIQMFKTVFVIMCVFNILEFKNIHANSRSAVIKSKFLCTRCIIEVHTNICIGTFILIWKNNTKTKVKIF